ncbi:hypothetical protein J1614_012049 [Plenodomus biglobosus]|nr:hypothetical protein J1614_012049 [Plenodomus biglobosus]
MRTFISNNPPTLFIFCVGLCMLATPRRLDVRDDRPIAALGLMTSSQMLNGEAGSSGAATGNSVFRREE